jgi:gluconolactonase
MRLHAFLLLLVINCSPKNENHSIGYVERLDPALDQIISSDASIEIIAEGFEWSEGPLWLAEQKTLLFSDVPKNIAYQWNEAKGLDTYLTPSGYTSAEPKDGESGSNGLILDDEGNLILCQHGDRRLAKMNASLDNPSSEFTTIANTYNNKRFNSPNDAVLYQHHIYFTDPPYGLKKQDNDPKKELPFQGVYQVAANGNVTLIIDSLSRPNGLAFFPNQKTLLVANSDKQKARWYRFDFNEQDSITHASVFYDATNEAQLEKGLPDGLKIDRHGNVYATGPGGVWIFNATGKLLGKIKISEATSNCALADDDKTLYITADRYVLRVKLR